MAAILAQITKVVPTDSYTLTCLEVIEQPAAFTGADHSSLGHLLLLIAD
jgi:hypothetical protein